ncbi:MAG: D-2-hydroxyacid dehydrogenase [Oscillospiraceae bacterium]
MKIVVLDGYTENPGDLSWAGLEALGSVTVYDRTEPEKILSRIGDADTVLLNKTPITAATLACCPQLKYIGVLATGYNVVDTSAAKAQGVVVCNIPTYGTTAVAQFVFALLLELCHHVGDHGHSTQSGRWAACPDFCYWDTPLVELAGKTMGFIGFGRIGQNAAQIAKAFGMEILAYDAYENDSGRALGTYVTLDELLARSHVVSLHCPLFPETTGLINRTSIAKMRDGAMLINTSRGPLIVDEDLAEALNSGKLAGAGLDVLSAEPPQAENPLLTAQNCIVTPHIAWAPRESRSRLMDIAVDNVRHFAAGAPINVVN